MAIRFNSLPGFCGAAARATCYIPISAVAGISWLRRSQPRQMACKARPQETNNETNKEPTMSNGSTLSLPEIEDRIAIIRDNIRQLIEIAAADSGAADEDRNADRIAQQNEELDKLVKQRDALLKK
jgi:hypothetical protein